MLYILGKVNEASQRSLAKFSIRAKLSVYDFGRSSLPFLLDYLTLNDDGGGDNDELFLWYTWPRKGVQPYFLLEPLPESFTITNLRHAASRILIWTDPRVQLSWMKLRSSNYHCNTAPRHAREYDFNTSIKSFPL